jgi:hypothetical protein
MMAVQPEFELDEEEEEGSPESNSGDSSYDKDSDEVVERSSTPVAGIKSAGEYDTPIVSLVEGNTGNSNTKDTVIRSSGKYVFLFVVFFLYYVYFS